MPVDTDNSVASPRNLPAGYKSSVLRFGLGPALFYFACFCILTYPLILQFSTHLFAETTDGFQNAWNLWWMKKALLGLHQSPWQTAYLYYPHGTSLISHDLNPLNGFIGIFLSGFMGLNQVYNTLLLIAFTASGLTMFWLAYYLTRSYAASLLAGFIFTFSAFHFGHAEGHLEMISLHWIPLFILCWLRLLAKPSYRRALLAALVLLALALTSFYFAFYCVMAGALIAFGYTIQQRDLRVFIRRTHLPALLLFTVIVLATVGPLIGTLVILNQRDHIIPSHAIGNYSLDLPALLIPGAHWRFADLTKGYWSKISGNADEHGASLGIIVWLTLIYVLIRQRRIDRTSPQAFPIWWWFVLWAYFIVLSLGPVLHIAGTEIGGIPMPYALLEKLIPTLRISSLPVRMTAMTMLFTAILAAIGFKALLSGKNQRSQLLITAALLVVFSVEYLPRPLPANAITIPGYVDILKAQPGNHGLADIVTLEPTAMYYQTIHEKPLAFAYTSRISLTTRDFQDKIRGLIKDQQYDTLCKDYDLHYLIVPPTTSVLGHQPSARSLYSDDTLSLYDLGCQ